MDENINQVDKDQFGFATENPEIPVEGIEVQAGDDHSPEVNRVDVDQPILSEEPVQEQQAETQQGSEEQPAKEDPSRFEYWQSQSDKVTGELRNVREELDYYKGQIAQGQQQSSPPNGQIQGTPQQADPGSKVLRAPEKPPKPVNYNEVDAYNDPESISFKYRMAKERYGDNYLKWLEYKDAHRENQMQRAYKESMMQQQQQMLHQNTISHAQNTWGWDGNKAQEFVQWAVDPGNVTMDHLAKLFEMKDGPNRDVVQHKAAEMQRSKEMLTMPRTASVESGKSESPMSDEQSFNAGLMSLKR